ncbi:hypothetical protein Taro_037619 [Colocasia esculenta]|uniref:Uncharacterized protein n=1 Tax=Colocasia esculenta TaxID=4460 RepID=A0A843WAB3_COLES|nr:hypothetical protein [Colocasia esculenta]
MSPFKVRSTEKSDSTRTSTKNKLEEELRGLQRHPPIGQNSEKSGETSKKQAGLQQHLRAPTSPGIEGVGGARRGKESGRRNRHQHSFLISIPHIEQVSVG